MKYLLSTNCKELLLCVYSITYEGKHAVIQFSPNLMSEVIGSKLFSDITVTRIK